MSVILALHLRGKQVNYIKGDVTVLRRAAETTKIRLEKMP